MSDTIAVSLDPVSDESFPSAAALRAAHSSLLRRERTERETRAFLAEVAQFIQRGRASGKLIDDVAERRASQSMLDYWATVLYRVDGEIIDSTLDEFDPALAPTLDDALCPYVGLEAFREINRDRFFGRRRLSAEVLDRFAEQRLLAVVGPSGSGKSSLVLGGLLPALKAGGLPDSQHWHYVPPLVPGSDPLTNLAGALRPPHNTSDVWTERLRAGMLQDPTYLTKLINALTRQPALLVIDQFEEAFTLCADQSTRRAFINNLLVLASAPGARHTVVLTMRSDFESFVARIPHFQSVFEDGQVRVTPMSAPELREAIEEPARQIGLKIEPRVVDALVNDIIGEPAALPLLQFTLLKLWEQRDHNRVTWEAYQRVGGGRLALARSADAFYNSLSLEQQRTVRRILLRMVRPTEGLEFTSNRIRRAQLYQGSEAAYRIDEVLDKLVQARLVRLTEAETPEDAQVEVAHEALVRNWPTLVDWLEEEREAMRERQRLVLAAENWKARGEDPGALLRGSTLSDALRLPADDLGQVERDFLRASLREKLRIEQAQEAARRHEIEQAHALAEEQRLRAEEQAQRAKIERKRAEERARAALRLRWAALGLAVALAFAALAALVAFRNATAADQQRAAAVVAQSTAEGALATARADAIRRSTAESQANFARETAIIAQRTAEANAQTFGTAKAQADTARAQAVGAQQAAQNEALVLSTAKAEADSAAAQARTAEADNAARADALDRAVATQQALLQSQIGTDKLVDLSAQALDANDVPRALQLAMAASTFSQGSKVEDALQAAIARARPPIRHGSADIGITWSPDNQHLASAGNDGVVRIWDVSTQEQTGAFRGHTGRVTGVAWSPDGQRIVSTDMDGVALVWDPANGRQTARFNSHTRAVYSAAWSPDSRLIVTSGDDAMLRIWEASSGKQVKSMLAFGSSVTEAAWHPDGSRFVAATGNAAIIRDMDGNRVATLSGHAGPVRSAAWNPNRETIVTASDDGTVKIWEASSGQLLATEDKLGGSVNSARWYPSGNYLVTAGDDGVVRIWDVKDWSDPHKIATLQHNARTVAAVWNAKGLRLASAASDGTIRIYGVLFDDILGEARQLFGRDVTREEAQQLLNDAPNS